MIEIGNFALLLVIVDVEQLIIKIFIAFIMRIILSHWLDVDIWW